MTKGAGPPGNIAPPFRSSHPIIYSKKNLFTCDLESDVSDYTYDSALMI
jgi:hypothetical protein